jgi:Tryptophan-associated transmembrane protein (Trp_oprn_chp)
VPERDLSRRALAATIVALIAASAMLGGAAMLGWAQVDAQVPLRGIVQVQVAGSAVLPALGPLALLALAAVAAVLATGGWARGLLGALLLVVSVLPTIDALRVADARWLTTAAMSAVELPARSVPVDPAGVLLVGPALAAGGAALLVAAGVVLVLRGYWMPRLGSRYQAPTGRPNSSYQVTLDGRLWEQMDAGEDPTASGHPR